MPGCGREGEKESDNVEEKNWQHPLNIFHKNYQTRWKCLTFSCWYLLPDIFNFLCCLCAFDNLLNFTKEKKGEIILESIRRTVGCLWHWNSLFLTTSTRPQYAGFWIHLDLSLSPPQIRQEPWRSLHHSWSQNLRQKLNTRCLQPGDSRGDSSHSGDGNHFLPYPLASTSCSNSYPAPPSSSPLSVSTIIPTYGGWGSDTLYTWFPSGQSLSQSASLCGTMKTI